MNRAKKIALFSCALHFGEEKGWEWGEDARCKQTDTLKGKSFQTGAMKELSGRRAGGNTLVEVVRKDFFEEKEVPFELILK